MRDKHFGNGQGTAFRDERVVVGQETPLVYNLSHCAKRFHFYKSIYLVFYHIYKDKYVNFRRSASQRYTQTDFLERLGGWIHADRYQSLALGETCWSKELQYAV